MNWGSLFKLRYHYPAPPYNVSYGVSAASVPPAESIESFIAADCMETALSRARGQFGGAIIESIAVAVDQVWF
jgi:hypothetical protein